MKKTLLSVWALLLCLFSFAQNSAPSSHMGANDNASGDIIMKTVRSSITTTSTYYCTMQWNAGGEGGAYCGFQDSPDKGHQFIYSIWDPSNGEPITAAYRPDGTTVQNFGGEGTGLKSENQVIGWDLNEWNTLVTRRWDVGNHTYFGFWIRRDSKNQWHHMVTMDYPVANVNFNGGTNAFLEDWLATGSNTRRFEMKGAFKRKLDGSWLPMTQGNYSVNSGDIATGGRSENFATAYDATENNGVFSMQIGGSTTPSFTGTSTTLITSTYFNEPQNPTIVFTITGAATNNVVWDVPVSSTPQFKFTIKVNNITVGSEIEPEVRHFNLSASEGDSVDVIIEDILGRTSTVSTTIATGTIDDPVAIDYSLANGTYKIAGVESGKVISPTNSNSKTTLASYNNSPQHHWQITSIGDDKYELINAGYNQPMDAFGGVNKVGIYGYHGQANQQWYITHVGDGRYKLTSVGQGKSAKAAGTTAGSDVDLSNFSGHESELFTFTLIEDIELPEGTYKITNVGSGKTLYSNGINVGANVELIDYNQSTNAQWQITVTSAVNKIYKIINIGNGYALDCTGPTDNSNTETWGFHGDLTQQWRIKHLGDGKFRILSNYGYGGNKSLHGKNIPEGETATSAGGSSFTPLEGYNVELLEHNYENTFQEFTFTLVSEDQSLSINNINTKNKDYFKFFPNPASKTLNILIDNKINKSNVLVELYNLTGVLVTKKNVDVGLKNEINISNLTTGLYILKSEGVTQKLIVM